MRRAARILLWAGGLAVLAAFPAGLLVEAVHLRLQPPEPADDWAGFGAAMTGMGVTVLAALSGLVALLAGAVLTWAGGRRHA